MLKIPICMSLSTPSPFRRDRRQFSITRFRVSHMSFLLEHFQSRLLVTFLNWFFVLLLSSIIILQFLIRNNRTLVDYSLHDLLVLCIDSLSLFLFLKIVQRFRLSYLSWGRFWTSNTWLNRGEPSKLTHFPFEISTNFSNKI